VKGNKGRSKGLARLQAAGVLITLSAVSVLFSGRQGGAEPRQDARAVTSEGAATRFVVESDLVLVPITVTTGKGQAVPGLTKDLFSVFEDHVPQAITHFTAEDAPAAIGLVFDASDSMGPKMTMAQEAVYALLRNANPNDEFFLIRFSDHPHLMVPLTTDANEVRRAAEGLVVGGSTAVLDAINMAWIEMRRARTTRKAIVLISDGEDNASRLSREEFRRLAAENDPLIFTLFVGETPNFSGWHTLRTTGVALLDDIARQAGGRMFPVTNGKQLPQTAAKIGSWIRSQYVVGYVPTIENRHAGYHRIEVKLSRPPGTPKLHSSWRLGYYAPGE